MIKFEPMPEPAKPLVKTYPAAYYEGVSAYYRQELLLDCPYPATSNESTWWRKGLVDASMEGF